MYSRSTTLNVKSKRHTSWQEPDSKTHSKQRDQKTSSNVLLVSTFDFLGINCLYDLKLHKKVLR